MKKRFGKKKLLTAAVMAALLAAPGYGYAFKMAPEYVYDNGKPIVEIQFLTQGEGIIGMVDIAGYTLSPSLTDPVKSSAAYWTGIIGPKAKNETPWHVRPYVNAQLSRLWQNGYSEEGAGVFNQVVDSKHNDYFGMGAGVEFKRYLPGGNYAIRAGVRHAFAGAEPKLRYSYMGDAANTYDMRNVQDKTHFVLSVGVETQVAKGWSIGGDASFVRGSHDKDFSCSVTVKRMW